MVDPSATEILTRLTAHHIETEKFITDFYAGGFQGLPFDLAVPARDYQRTAGNLMLRVGGLLLADDVGLGKTVSFITILTQVTTRPALVVTLAHLPRQWQREVNRFMPGLSTHIIKQGTPYAFDVPDVIIINYHKLSKWADTLAPLVKSVCFDEIQELRRAESDKYRSAKYIAEHAAFRVGLSATPIYNYGGEFWNVLNVLRPDALGDAGEFGREWCNSTYFHEKSRIENPKAFGNYLRDHGLMLRRTRSEVKREIPAVAKYTQVVDADTATLEAVSKDCAELARIILRGEQEFKGQKLQASEELSNKLRQATGVAKAPYVAAFVRMLIESGEKVVLYGWHRMVYKIWMEALKEFNPVMYTGQESAVQKEASKEAFCTGYSKVLLISLRAGAGLDGLQHACRSVVFGELDWSPGALEQCVGRVARDGQKEPVTVYYLVAESGSDPIMVDVIGLKKNQIEGVRNIETNLFEKAEIDPNKIKRLAEAYLEQLEQE